uniref:Serine protease K12H4.7 n=1 Tax=Rhabditophanes sp. KR3021 TaxID=114890 RepID=A0AC35TIB8_9BILA
MIINIDKLFILLITCFAFIQFTAAIIRKDSFIENLVPFDSDGSGSKTFTNKVDHFNSFNKNTFDQRFYYNNLYYKTGGPVFLFFGGQFGQSNYWTTGSYLEISQLAQYHNALILHLEHRYYGQSIPTADLSTSNLKYLTSRQALADAAEFIKAFNKNTDIATLPAETKWVTFGSSYGASLSAWMRQMYPELVYASVASSPPLTAIVDFSQALTNVQQTLKAYDPNCSKNLTAGLAKVRELIKTAEGRNQIKIGFNMCDDWSKLSNDDISVFWNGLFQQYLTVVTYSLINILSYRSDFTIPNMCDYFTTANQTPLENLYLVTSWYRSLEPDGMKCLNVSYAQSIQYLSQTAAGTDFSDVRARFYQSCTEFGHFQTTDANTQFWGDVLNINFLIKQCGDVFGSTITNTTIYSAVQKTNTYYGGASGFRGTRTIVINGGNDPWRSLSLLTPTNGQNFAILTPNEGQSAEMYEAIDEADGDSIALRQTRQVIANKLKEWVGSA